MFMSDTIGILGTYEAQKIEVVIASCQVGIFFFR